MLRLQTRKRPGRFPMATALWALALVLILPMGAAADEPARAAADGQTHHRPNLGPDPQTASLSGGLSASVAGCLGSCSGEFLCQASVFGGSGSYNYWWMYSGSGQMYQTNSANVSITGCFSGSGTLTVQVRDRVTGKIARSAPYSLICGGLGGGFEGLGGFH